MVQAQAKQAACLGGGGRHVRGVTKRLAAFLPSPACARPSRSALLTQILIQRRRHTFPPANTFGEYSAPFLQVAIRPAPHFATTHLFHPFSQLNSPTRPSSSLLFNLLPASSRSHFSSSLSPALHITRILTAKQTSINEFKFFDSTFTCKYSCLLLLQNRALPRRVVVVAHRVFVRAV